VKNQVLACLFVTDESSGSEKKEATLSTHLESVAIKRKIWNREEPTQDECISSEAYGIENREKRVKQSTEKNLKAKVVSSKDISKEWKNVLICDIISMLSNMFDMLSW